MARLVLSVHVSSAVIFNLLYYRNITLLTCVMLFCVVLCFLALSCVGLSCAVWCCVVVCCVILCCLALSCLVVVLSCDYLVLRLSCLVVALSCYVVVFSCLIFFFLLFSCPNFSSRPHFSRSTRQQPKPISLTLSLSPTQDLGEMCDHISTVFEKSVLEFKNGEDAHMI